MDGQDGQEGQYGQDGQDGQTESYVYIIIQTYMLTYLVGCGLWKGDLVLKQSSSSVQAPSPKPKPTNDATQAV